VSDAEPILALEAVEVRYGKQVALHDVTTRVQGGAIGLLGPNGAGKSTTMRMLYRAAPIGDGRLRILGYDVGDGRNDRAIKRRMGVVPQEYNLDERLTARENLRVFARFYRLYGRDAAARVDEVLGFVAVADRADTLVEELSGGLKQRVQIARGLLGEPDILVLDEPTTGLDPVVRNALWERLVELRRGGTTLVLTTHYMDEAEKLCDRLVIMDRGDIVAEGSPAALIAEHATAHVLDLRVSDPAAREAIRDQLAARVERTAQVGDRLLLYANHGDELTREVTREHPDIVTTLRPGNLEDVFLRLTGHGLGGGSGGNR
jgi:lipooligosaccharide transport system ATP-binding protein